MMNSSMRNPNGCVLHIGYVAELDNFFATPVYVETQPSLGLRVTIRRSVTAAYGDVME